MYRQFRRLHLLGLILIFGRGGRAFLRKFDALQIISMCSELPELEPLYHRGRNIIIVVNIHGMAILDFLNIISLMYLKIRNN
jgi:hypothetical protein